MKMEQLIKLLIILVLFIGCNNQKNSAVCTISLRGKKIFIGEDLKSISQKLDIHKDLLNEEGNVYLLKINYLDFTDYVIIHQGALYFSNKKLDSVHISVNTSDGISKKTDKVIDFKSYYHLLKEFEDNNPCIYKNIVIIDSTETFRGKSFYFK